MWRAVLAVSLCAFGCDDFDVAPIDTSGAGLFPPYIDPPSVRPPTSVAVVYDRAADTAIEFRTGPIRDPNPDDLLYWRWFVDYGSDEGAHLIFEDGPADGRAPADMASGLSFSLTPCEVPIEFENDALHRVDVLVADRPFVSADQEPSDTATPNQVLAVEGRHMRLTWFLELTGECP
jgi:hypothetical protein